MSYILTPRFLSYSLGFYTNVVAFRTLIFMALVGSLQVRHDWATSLSHIGEGNGNPLQRSCLENPRDGGAWWAAVCGVAQSRTRLRRLSSSGSKGLSGGPDIKESVCSAGGLGSFPGWGRSPGGGPGNPLQYSRLETPQWTEEPGGLQSVGSQGAGRDWVTKHSRARDRRRGVRGLPGPTLRDSDSLWVSDVWFQIQNHSPEGSGPRVWKTLSRRIYRRVDWCWQMCTQKLPKSGRRWREGGSTSGGQIRIEGWSVLGPALEREWSRRWASQTEDKGRFISSTY